MIEAAVWMACWWPGWSKMTGTQVHCRSLHGRPARRPWKVCAQGHEASEDWRARTWYVHDNVPSDGFQKSAVLLRFGQNEVAGEKWNEMQQLHTLLPQPNLQTSFLLQFLYSLRCWQISGLVFQTRDYDVSDTVDFVAATGDKIEVDFVYLPVCTQPIATSRYIKILCQCAFV